MESFWGKLKQEWLNEQHFHIRKEAGFESSIAVLNKFPHRYVGEKRLEGHCRIYRNKKTLIFR